VHVHTPKPTTDLKEVQDAIGKIPQDESGLENMCQTVAATIDKYAVMARKSDRRLCIVLVTDESGDDGAGVEEVITRAKRAKAPIYILGRESVFGYPYARQIWRDKNITYHFGFKLIGDRKPRFPKPYSTMDCMVAGILFPPALVLMNKYELRVRPGEFSLSYLEKKIN